VASTTPPLHPVPVQTTIAEAESVAAQATTTQRAAALSANAALDQHVAARGQREVAEREEKVAFDQFSNAPRPFFKYQTALQRRIAAQTLETTTREQSQTASKILVAATTAEKVAVANVKQVRESNNAAAELERQRVAAFEAAAELERVRQNQQKVDQVEAVKVEAYARTPKGVNQRKLMRRPRVQAFGHERQRVTEAEARELEEAEAEAREREEAEAEARARRQRVTEAEARARKAREREKAEAEAAALNWDADLRSWSFFSDAEMTRLRKLTNDKVSDGDLGKGKERTRQKPAVNEIRENPWLLFLIDVISFDRAADLARVLCCPVELRIKWNLKHELHLALTRKGHMCMQTRHLSQSLARNPGFTAYVATLATRQRQTPLYNYVPPEKNNDPNYIPPENEYNAFFFYTTLSGARDIIKQSKRMITEPVVVTDDGFLYLGPVYRYETHVVRYILDYGVRGNNTIDSCQLQPLNLDDAQSQFVRTVLSAHGGVHVLTGGAGTGKTRTIMELLRLYTGSKYVCAPTGKAVSNIKQKLVHDADWLSTIHCVLYSSNAQIRLGNARLIIIDEFSMVDLKLFSRLLMHVDDKPRTALVLVGDENQLYPVSYGKVLRDFIDSPQRLSSTTRLISTYRQDANAAGSLILRNASALLGHTGETSWRRLLHTSHTFRVYTPARSTELCSEVCAFVFTKGYPFIQVLCQTNDQCEEINRGIQQLLPASSKLEIKVKDVTLFVIRENDRLICVKNMYVNYVYVDYHNAVTNEYIRKLQPANGHNAVENDEYIRKLQHANGDTATVTKWTNGSVMVHWDVDVGESAQTVWAIDEFVDYFKLAYAITIHKSQGSEYDAGVVVLSPKCRWFAQRSSLYTAITRFKSECAIFALDVDLDAAINAPMHLPVIGNMAKRLQAAEA
jgi:hypothetical protein